jgi:hypothetical protein
LFLGIALAMGYDASRNICSSLERAMLEKMFEILFVLSFVATIVGVVVGALALAFSHEGNEATAPRRQ